MNVHRRHLLAGLTSAGVRYREKKERGGELGKKARKRQIINTRGKCTERPGIK